jgi:DNA polymerase-1
VIDMRQFDATLGGRDALIFAPELGDFDPAAFAASFPSGQLYGLDVESTYLTGAAHWSPDFRVRLLQVATEGYAWVLRMDDPAQRLAAEALLADPFTEFCSHTNMDVLAVSTALGVDITDRSVDTRLLAILADPDKDDDRDLKTLATKYGMPELAAADKALDEIFLAMYRQVFPGTGRRAVKASTLAEFGWSAVPADNEIYLTYAGLDAIACRRLVPLLLAATGDPAELIRLDCWLNAQANKIQARGVRVDTERLEALYAEHSGKVDRAKAEALELSGVNIQGPKLVPWLAEHGVDWSTWPGPLTDTGAPSLAKEAVRYLDGYELDQVGTEVVARLKAMKASLDIRNKTSDMRERLADGRLHPLLNVVGASTTARMSSAGPNMQNFSKKDPLLRGLFLPEPGHVLGTIDFAQIELRVVAALAREAKMIEVIKSGGDLHQLTVDELAEAGVTITRDQAKIVNFLIVYGGGANALWEQTGIPLYEASEIINTWRSRYPAITELARYMGGFTEFIRTISNRRLPVTTNRRTKELRAYANINYLVQSSARELLADAWWRFAQAGYGPMVWWAIHDELVLQIPAGREDEVMRAAERAMTFDFMGVPIQADAILLLDENGDSRWMTSKRAEAIRGKVAA